MNETEMVRRHNLFGPIGEYKSFQPNSKMLKLVELAAKEEQKRALTERLEELEHEVVVIKAKLDSLE